MADSTITQAMVQGYRRNLYMLAEQSYSKLRSCVDIASDLVGKKHAFERIGSATGQKITTRHGDTPLNEIAHSRRWLTLTDYDTAAPLDKEDELRLLIEPKNSYVMRQAGFMGRTMDSVIVDAMLGTAEYGVDGGLSQSFDTSNNQVTISAGATTATGLTIAKLRIAKKILDLAQFDDASQERYIATTGNQLYDLLGTTEVTSADYNTVKALVNGDINTFLGFKFVNVNGLRPDGTRIIPVNASSHRRCVAWIPGALKFGLPKDVTVKISERADKRYMWQVYSCMALGAVRMEESGIVEILCYES